MTQREAALVAAIDRRLTKIEREIETVPEARRAQLLEDVEALSLIINALEAGRLPLGKAHTA